ncbi:LysR family transcriptional regulator [Thalassospira lohafexi]|mgnify:CR=1 FL=1|jgi:DNA-binding transcriptional LysR family regulator|uniref:LysR family transcriptional regulator n=1 Tax=Thalassospira lohafexi TaxID=744227 RepID=A0A2N3L7M0_9PROT|nr:LysR family transcriptional regulator [Thalassospira lohafexi]PKR58700.1 LysR family transcriptional regulator [Thalassospira lohafexi]|tara:strand:+ start:6339 stop:7247 length:909 start_codon:yes stop_codon:yes gene_type:complete
MSVDSDLGFFVLLVRKGNLSAAAQELNLSPPAVSKRLAKLEDRLGVRLLNRTTRRISLTSEGDAYFQSAEQIMRQIDDLEQRVSHASETPAGLLRVNATFGFGREYVAPVVSEFSHLYPEVEVQLLLTDIPMNMVEEGIDLGIRFGGLPNSRIRARKLQGNRRFLCAAPSYLKRYGTPRSLSDLVNHNCIILRQDKDVHDLWKLQRGQHSETVKVHGTLSSNDGEIALRWVLDGHGIMMRSEWDIGRHVEADRLRLVLPQYAHVDADIYAVYPERHNLSAKVRIFIDFLHRNLRENATGRIA